MKNIEVLKMIRPEFGFVVGDDFFVVYDGENQVLDEDLLAKIEKEYANAEPGFADIQAKKAERIAALKRLEELDVLSLRPLRAILAGNGTDADKGKLTAIEEEAKALRKSL